MSFTYLSPPLPSIPADIHAARDYETVAKRFIAAPCYEYIAGGAGIEATLAANLAAFASLTVCPRVLVDVTSGHTRLELSNDTSLAHPILLAPVAHQQLVHPGAEIETARAAEATDTCMIVSTLSSCSLENIANASRSQRWFQLYFQPDRAVTLDLVRRAEAAGYRALVVTIDAAIQVPGARALRAGFAMPDLRPANLRDYEQRPGENAASPTSRIFRHMRDAPTWSDVDWLLTNTKMPVWIKGVLHPEDARALQARGVAGIVVSNHGGRGLDGSPATLHALPTVRNAVGENFPLLLDGGVRCGMDVFKAIARGADGVLIGRLQLYALSVAGALGVAHLIKLLREELEICMALTGCTTLNEVRHADLR